MLLIFERASDWMSKSKQQNIPCCVNNPNDYAQKKKKHEYSTHREQNVIFLFQYPVSLQYQCKCMAGLIMVKKAIFNRFDRGTEHDEKITTRID
jgi:hypothetical protein